MNKGKKISLEEQKKLQLEMLVEIDEFCRSHNIKYMLAYGTLLGAIRHKGYIPWDDDMDISMPINDMIRFKKEFRSEKLKYCDVDTEDYYEFCFPRVANKQTYNKRGLVCRSYGVCIDLYPTFEVSLSKEINRKVVDRIYPEFLKWRTIVRLCRKIIKVLPITKVPYFNRVVRRYRDIEYTSLSYTLGGAFYCMSGPLPSYESRIFDFNPFDEMIEVEFEGHRFMAPARYHEYLAHHYGNYMQLPPEDQRQPYHGGKYYWNFEPNAL